MSPHGGARLSLSSRTLSLLMVVVLAYLPIESVHSYHAPFRLSSPSPSINQRKGHPDAAHFRLPLRAPPNDNERSRRPPTATALCSVLPKQEAQVSNNHVVPFSDGSSCHQGTGSNSTSPLAATEYNHADNTMLTIMMTLIFIVGSLSSLDRVAMSVALVPMSEEMVLSDSVKGSISSFFSLGYGLGIVPAGLLLSKLSPRAIMAAGIFLWSLGTMATPFAAGHGDMNLLLGARALVGASESCVIPSIQQLLSNWVAAERKSRALAIVFCGFQTGTILAYSLSPILIDQTGDWRSIFYAYGGAGLLFLVPWLILAKDGPATSAAVEDQKGRLKGELDRSGKSDDSSMLESAKAALTSAPWRQFAASKSTWAMFLAHAANNWGLYINLSWTPTFYAEQYGLDVKESALLLVVPSLAGAIGGLSAGSTADAVIKNMEEQSEEMITLVRRTFQGIALFGPALCLAILASNIPEEPRVAQTLFAVAVGMQSFNAAGYGAANQEKAGPKWTGLLYSVTSLPSVLLGTVAVFLTGYILDATNQDWSYVFALNAVVYALGAVAFVSLYDSRREFD